MTCCRLSQASTHLVAAYNTLSAMSLALSGMMPSYTASAFEASPLYRTLLNSVWTAPGLMAVTCKEHVRELWETGSLWRPAQPH